jgi:peptidoglycan/xylan/chitin deacetylase (PgdA/CDA1 family)
MWNEKKKAVTFSYDDGVTQDKRLTELFNFFQVKCTFNLNSGLQSYASSWDNNGLTIHRMNALELPRLYKGHEVAVHCLTHANLIECDEDTIYNEVCMDKQNLEKIFGVSMNGMAYPYGTYNDTVADVLKKCGIRYARTVESSKTFDIPQDFLRLRPTCHHDDKNIMMLIDDFLDFESEIPQLFYIWGHSYEFDVNNNWDQMEKILDKLAGKEEIFYGTNSQVLLY